MGQQQRRSATTATSTGSVVLYGGAQDITGADITDFRNLVITGGDKTLVLDAMAGSRQRMK